MSRMFQLTLLAWVAVGWAVLATVAGCADSTASSAVQIETVREVFPSATGTSIVPTNRDVQETVRSGNPIINEVRDPSGLLGYSVLSEVVGRSGPFKIQILLDRQYTVKRATVISYPWPRGREVARRSFTSQFEGRGPEDAIEIGKDIDAVSGATISCQAMAQGVRQAIRLIAE